MNNEWIAEFIRCDLTRSHSKHCCWAIPKSRLIFPKPFSGRSSSGPSAGNTFTGTKELEFFDAQNTKWSGNSLPSGVCVDNISSDDGNSVRQSTFTGSDGLPGNC